MFSTSPTRQQGITWYILGLGGIWLLACLPIAWFDLQNRWMRPDASSTIFIKLWLYWAVWAILPILMACLLQLRREMRQPARARKPKTLARLALAILVLTVGGWSSLIETRMLRVSSHTFNVPTQAQPLRLALVSDLHLGLFWRTWQLEALVKKINALQVDAVIVAGDWTYEPPLNLQQAFAPLRQLHAPIYGVMGNHDLQAPGANYADALSTALNSLGVQVLDGKSAQLKNWSIVGIGDRWGDQPERHIQQHLRNADPLRLVITHQPDTAASFPANAAFLTLSGHTHGGQIRLPWLTEKMLQNTTEHAWYQGHYPLPQGGRLFVTGGVGTIGLPARLGVIPSIELLEIRPDPSSDLPSGS